MIDGCSLELCVATLSVKFCNVIWHCATEMNSIIQLHDSFVMVPLESISLHYITLHYIATGKDYKFQSTEEALLYYNFPN